MEFEPGKILNDCYRLESVIAKGGMGSIYLATDLNLSIFVAIKENLFSTDAYVRQFQREANMLATLRHANLPRVTEHFLLPGIGQYLVMDYIEGEDLRQRLKRSGALSEQEVLFIGVSICNTLQYLHGLVPPIVHRDIKPGNIKITPKGDIVLVDFGLAKIYSVGKMTTIGAQSLTPGYAPPEQYGQGTEPRSDLYALGATLYAALTNTIPEDGISRAMGTAQLTPIQSYNPKVSSRVIDCIIKAMSVEINDRFRDASEFKQALQQADRSTLTLTKPITELRLTPSPAKTVLSSRSVSKRKQKIWAVLAGLLMIPIIILALKFFLLPLFSYFGPHEIQVTTTAMLPSRTISVKVNKTPVTENNPIVLSASETVEMFSSPTITPTNNGTPIGGGSGQIAFVSVIGDVPQIFLMNLDGSNKMPLTNLLAGACQPAWSPDGLKMVFTSPCLGEQSVYEGSSLFIMDLKTSMITPLQSIPGGDFDPTWSPSGEKIAFASLRDGAKPHIYIYFLNLDTSPLRLSPMVAYDRAPSWSPDETRIAFISTRGGFQQVWLINPDGSGVREFSLLDSGKTDEPSWSPDGKLIIYSKGSLQAAMLATRSTIQLDSEEIELDRDFIPAHKPVFSSDGFWLLCESNGEIYRLDINGNNPINLTKSTTFDFDPAVRP